jgi:cell division protein FtsB
MIDILRHVAADPKERRSLEAEWLAMIDEEEYEQVLKTIAARDKTIEDLEAKVKKLEQQIKSNNT